MNSKEEETDVGCQNNHHAAATAVREDDSATAPAGRALPRPPLDLVGQAGLVAALRPADQQASRRKRLFSPYHPLAWQQGVLPSHSLE